MLAPCLVLVAAPAVVQIDGLRGATFDAAKFETEEGGQTLAHGDLDGDGRLDLLVPNAVTAVATLSLLFGREDGTFDPTVALPSISGVSRAMLGDVDGDGDLDAIVGGVFGSVVQLHRNLGARSFATQATVASGVLLGDLALAQVDGDGVLDLVLTNIAARTVEVRLGDGAGGFQAPLVHPSPFEPFDLELGDLDLDGHADLVQLQFGGAAFAASLGDGAGNFGSPTVLALAPGARNLALRDATGDGRLDVLGVDTFAGTVSLRVGLGGVAFAPRVALAVGAEPNSVEVADLDADGIRDLVVTRESTFDVRGGRIVTVAGLGGGAFGSQRTYACGSNPSATVIADFDGDGALDVAARNAIGRDVSIVRGAGDGTLLAPRAFELGADPASLDIGDFNGDGLADLATASALDLSIVVLAGDGSGAFGGAPVRSVTGVDTRSAEAADLDGDGDLDLVVGGRRGFVEEFAVARNDGTGRFTVAQRITLPFSTPITGRWALGDVTGDGRADLVHARSTLEIEVLRGLGDGTFGAGTTQFFTLGSLGVLALVDLDGDTRLDLLVSQTATTTYLAAQLGVGDGTFTAGPFQAVGMFLNRFATGDVDGDGAADVVLTGEAQTGAPLLAVWRGVGDGSFVVASTRNPRRGIHLLALGDIDVDGDADVVTATGEVVPDVELLTSNGDGTLAAPEHFNARREASALALADVNGDGNLDVAVASEVSSDVTVLVNRAAPRLAGFCDAAPSSTGRAARLSGAGSRSIAADHFTLRVDDAPPGQLVVFFAGALAGARPLPSGLLCIQSPLTRLTPGLPSGAAGSAATAVSFGALGLTAGTTHHFQAWFTDAAPAGASSGFSTALRVLPRP